MMPIERQRQIIDILSQQGRALVAGRAEWCLARQLPDIELNVLTHSLRTVETRAVKSNLRTRCLSGEYSARNEDFTGVVAARPLTEFLINKAFFSCGSLGTDGYLREGNE